MEEDKKQEEEKLGQSPSEQSEPEQAKAGTEERKEEPKKEEGDQNASIDERTQKKVICSLAYLFGILFFLPLVVYPNDEFAKFHANQALIVLLTVVIGEVIFGILNVIPGVGFVFGILCGVFGLLMLIACIFAILGVVREEKFELPLLGKIKILK